VLAKAKAALSTAKSVHILGSVTNAGKPQKLDLSLEQENGAGTISLQGFPVNFVKFGSVGYIKAPAAYWAKQGSSGPQLGKLLADKWITLPGSADQLSSFSLKSFASNLGSKGSPLQPEVKTTTLNGKKALVLSQKDGSTLYVSDDSSAYPLRITNTKPADKGQLDFSDYDKVSKITAPKGAVSVEKAVKG